MDSATAVTAARKATKNILYTVANSNAMNGMGENVKWGYSLPGWVRMLIGFNVGITLLLAGWGAIVINLSIKSLRQKKN
jgi:beta-glucosidase